MSNLNTPTNVNIKQEIQDKPDIDAIKNKTSELENSTSKVLDRVAKLIGDVKQDLTVGSQKTNSNVDNLRNRVNSILSDLSNLQQESKKNERDLELAIAARDKLLSEYRVINEKLNTTNSLTEKQSQEIKNLEQELNKAKDTKPEELEKLQIKVKDLVRQVQMKELEIQKLKSSQGADQNAINLQIQDLENIEGQLKDLQTRVNEQGSSIDNSFGEFNRQVSSAQGFVDQMDNTVKNVGTMIGSFFTFGGGSKKRKNLKYHKRSRKTLEKLAKKWGMKNVKKYRTKSQLIVALTLIVIFKTKSKLYKKSDLIVIAKNLDIKLDKKITKKELESKIEKKTRRFSFKDLY